MAEREVTPERAQAEAFLAQLPKDHQQTLEELRVVGVGVKERFAARAAELNALGYFPTETLLRDSEGDEEGVPIKALFVSGSGGGEYGFDEVVVAGTKGVLHRAETVKGYGENRGLLRDTLTRVPLEEYPLFEEEAYEQMAEVVLSKSGIREEEKLNRIVSARRRDEIHYAQNPEFPMNEIGEQASALQDSIADIREIANREESGITEEQLGNVFLHLFLAADESPGRSGLLGRYGGIELTVFAGSFIGAIDTEVGQALHAFGMEMGADSDAKEIISRMLRIPFQTEVENAEIYNALGRRFINRVADQPAGQIPYPSYAPIDAQTRIGDENVSIQAGEITQWLLSTPNPKTFQE